MIVVCNKTVNGVTAVRKVTTPATGDQGLYVKSIVGVGNPFWAWPSVPSGQLVGADFQDAPICNTDPAVNNQLIDAITTDPMDVLIYA